MTDQTHADEPTAGDTTGGSRPGGLVASRSRAGRRVDVVVGDLTEAGVDAIVCPANSYGTMGGGVADAIARAGGADVESEAVRQAPIPLGSAVLTTAGNMPSRWVVHAPTMYEPVEEATEENVRRAMEAALALCEEHELATVAFPGMGTGVGRMPYADAARVMVSAIDAHAQRRPALIKLVASNGKLARAWQEALGD